MSLTRSRKPAAIGSNQSSRRDIAISASDCRDAAFVLLPVTAWSPPADERRHLGFNHPETTPPSIPTKPRTAPVPFCSHTVELSVSKLLAAVSVIKRATGDFELEAAATRCCCYSRRHSPH